MTYGEIRTAFLAILNRSDCTNALADQFIEQGIFRSQRALRLRSQETLSSTTIATDGQAVTLPTDLLRLIAVYVEASTSKQLERLSLDAYLAMQPDGTSELPKYYTRDRGTILLSPGAASGTVVKVYYYAEFEDFASDNDETDLSAVAPDLFIYGGLPFAAEHFLDERLTRFEQRYQTILAELQGQSDDEELAGGATIKPAYAFPDEDY